MSIVGNTNIRYTGTDSADTRESVYDSIVDMAPMQVPLMSMATRGETPANITHEWRIDYTGAYPSTSTAIAWRGEGEDANPAATAARPALFNRTGIIGYEWAVSHTELAVKKFGIANEFDYQAVKHARKCVRDFNWALMNSSLDIDSSGPNAGSDDLKRKMGGLRTMIADLVSGGTNAHVSAGTIPSGAHTNTAAQAGSNLAISDFTGIQQTVMTAGGTPNGAHYVLAAPATKLVISKTISPQPDASGTLFRRYFDGSSMEVALPVDVLQTDFGLLYLMIDLSVPSGTAVGFDPEYFHLNVLRDFETIELAKVGPSVQGMVEAEMTCSLVAPNTAWSLTSIS